jgi:serine/threonine-protein kinase
MTYVEGQSLAQLLRERERLPLAAVASLVRDVASGLHDVHDAGLVHLDVKPSNVMLTEAVESGSRWCLVDFGVARLVAGAAPGAIAGTSGYMAPEQALGGEIDARADLYSLCLVIYRALTGRPPFPGTERVALAEAARRGPPDPRTLVAISEDLVRFLRIGLAADPADRWPSAAALRVAFERALEGQLRTG